jgi:hypothetical protein
LIALSKSLGTLEHVQAGAEGPPCANLSAIEYAAAIVVEFFPLLPAERCIIVDACKVQVAAVLPPKISGRPILEGRRSAMYFGTDEYSTI